MADSGGQKTTLIIAGSVLGVVALIFAAAIGIGTGFTPQSAGARESRPVIVTNPEEQALIRSLNLAINSCETLVKNREGLDTIRASLTTILPKLKEAKNDDGSSKLTPELEEELSDLISKIEAQLDWFAKAIDQCSTNQSISKEVEGRWITTKELIETLTSGELLGSTPTLFIADQDENFSEEMDDTGVIATGSTEVPLIKQGNYKNVAWPKPGQRSGTVSSSGCGLVSMAMVLRYYGHTVNGISNTDHDAYIRWIAADTLRNNGRSTSSGVNWEGYRKRVEQFGTGTNSGTGPSNGFSFYKSPEYTVKKNWDKIFEHLRNKTPVILSGNGKRKAPFSRGGHLIVLVGVSDDGKTIYVNNPGTRSDGKAKGYSIEWINSFNLKYYIVIKPK